MGRHSPAALRLRDAVDADLPALGRLFVEVNGLHVAFRPDVFRAIPTGARVERYLAFRLDEDDCRIFVADLDRAPIGFLLARLWQAPRVPIYWQRQEIEVEIVVVAEAARGLGIGRALIRRAHLWAAEVGVERVRLTVHEVNEGARRFYERLGYTTEQRIMSRPVDPSSSAGEDG